MKSTQLLIPAFALIWAMGQLTLFFSQSFDISHPWMICVILMDISALALMVNIARKLQNKEAVKTCKK